MGLFDRSDSPTEEAKQAATLQRVSNVPIGAFQEFSRHTEPITLKLQEKRLSWTGDSFYIKDAASDQPVLECKAKAFSLHGRKEFNDLQGRTLFLLKKKILAFHATYEAVPPDNEDHILFTIKKSFSIGKAKLNVTLRNAADGQEMTLALRGDFFDRKASITLGDENGPIVGQIARDFFNKREFFSGQQTYFLTIAPGVDITMLAALCVCLDETENEQQQAA